MNPELPSAESAWQQILPHIRATKRRRRQIRTAAVGMALAALTTGLWIFQPPAATLPTAFIPAPPAPTPPAATLAVFHVDEAGRVHLQESASDDLGALELTLALDPVVAFGDNTDY